MNPKKGTTLEPRGRPIGFLPGVSEGSGLSSIECQLDGPRKVCNVVF